MTSSEELLLAGFAPLLQIWGGICLLFFYLEFFDKSPLNERWNRSLKSIRECCNLMLTKFQNLSPSNDQSLQLAQYIEHTKKADKITSPLWDTTRRAVYNLAKFGFFHIAILLIYIGFEGYGKSTNAYFSLLVIDIIAIIYIISDFIFYNKKFIQKSWGLYVCVALMLLSAILFQVFDTYSPKFQDTVNSINISRTVVTIITLIIATIAYLVVLLLDYARGASAIYSCDRAIKRINGLFDLWTDLSGHYPFWTRIKLFFMLVFTKDYSGFSEKTGRDRLEEYIQKRINKVLWPAVNRVMQRFPPSQVNEESSQSGDQSDDKTEES